MRLWARTPILVCQHLMLVGPPGLDAEPRSGKTQRARRAKLTWDRIKRASSEGGVSRLS